MRNLRVIVNYLINTQRAGYDRWPTAETHLSEIADFNHRFDSKDRIRTQGE
jgi:hypothetical protein